MAGKPIAEIIKANIHLILIAAVILVSRLPFLGAGFGTDPDAWRVANAAKAMATSGEYVISRPPGYPVHEILSAVMFKGGPWLTNGATALLSVVAVIYFILSLRLMNVRNHLLAGIMLAFTPIVYISSTATIDYVWALAFIMVSLYAILSRRYIWGGVFLGIAIGCRLTSAAMLLPLCIIITENRPSFSGAACIRDNARFLTAALMTAAIAFLPVFIRYGLSLFTFYDIVSPPLSQALRKLSFEVWGIGGTLVLAAIAAAATVFPKVFCLQDNGHNQQWRRFVRPSVVAIVIFLATFLRLPCEAGYLIPVVPFVLLILAGCLKKWVMIAACVAIVLTSFVDLKCPTCPLSFQEGPFITQHISRVRGVEFVNRILAEKSALPEKSVIVVAWWEPYIRLLRTDDENDSRRFIYCLDDTRLRDWTSKGYTIYHLPYVIDYNLTNYGIDLNKVSTSWNIPY